MWCRLMHCMVCAIQSREWCPVVLGADLRPVDACKRTFTGLDFLGLWVGLVVNIPSYYLAGSLVDLGKGSLSAHQIHACWLVCQKRL